MKKVCIFLLITALTVSFAACGGAVENKPANVANANTAKPAPAAPTADVLLGMEKLAQEAYVKGDSAHFEGILSDKMTMSMGKEHMNKAAVVAMIKTAKCDLTDGVKLSEPQMSRIDNDTYAFAYKNDSTGKCLENGKMVEQKPTRASTIWVRNGEKWQAAWHGETMIVEPKGDAKKDDAKKVDSAKADSAKSDVAAKADVSKDAIKKAEPKKDEAMNDTAKKEVARKEEMKKDDAKKEESKKDDKSAAPAAPTKPVASANTDALVKLHTSGWEAFKAKDAKKFDEMLPSNVAVVDPIGRWFSGKDSVIKQWTETMKCEGITKVSVTDGFASAISPTVELLTVKGSSDGTCDGQKNGALWQTAVYVKEGDAWKMAFMFETPA